MSEHECSPRLEAAAAVRLREKDGRRDAAVDEQANPRSAEPKLADLFDVLDAACAPLRHTRLSRECPPRFGPSTSVHMSAPSRTHSLACKEKIEAAAGAARGRRVDRDMECV